jgi:hypothetical protein
MDDLHNDRSYACKSMRLLDIGVWNLYFGPPRLGRLSEEKMRIEDAYGSLRRHKKPKL